MSRRNRVTAAHGGFLFFWPRECIQAQKKARVSVNLEAKKKAETAKAWMSTDLHPQYNKIASQRPYANGLRPKSRARVTLHGARLQLGPDLRQRLCAHGTSKHNQTGNITCVGRMGTELY